jgi:hypothetical protein
MGYSGAKGKLIHEKNQKQQISWHCPFKAGRSQIYYGLDFPQQAEERILRQSACLRNINCFLLICLVHPNQPPMQMKGNKILPNLLYKSTVLLPGCRFLGYVTLKSP